MSSVDSLREFINERLTAAAGEIFTVFQQTIVRCEEELDRQRKLMLNSWKPHVEFHTTESRQQHVGHQKTSSALEQEEHEAPHIKEEEELVEVGVPDDEGDDSHHSVRDWTTQRLTAAAVEIFKVFDQTMVQYQEEMERQRRLLEIIWKPQLKLHRIDLQQQHNCREEQLFRQEVNYCLEQEEPEPPDIKEEQEEPGPPEVKEEQEEPGPPEVKEEQEEPEPPEMKGEQDKPGPPEMKEEQEESGPPEIKDEPGPPEIQVDQQEGPELLQIKEHQEPSPSLEGDQPIMEVEGGSFRVSSIEEQRSLSEAEVIWNLEQAASRHSEVHNVKKQNLTVALGDRVDKFLLSEKKAEGEKLLLEETSGESVCQKKKSRTITNKKKHICETCGKHFSKPCHLLGHIRTHTGEKPYSCKTCGKSFSHKHQLLAHMRTHTGEKLYSCETCGKCFSLKHQLLVHIRTHTGEKPYSCETCGKHFSQQSYLSVHKRTHTGEKPYSCETCGKLFSTGSNLLVHKRTHTGEKPHSCETCGKQFGQRSNLLVHKRIHTGENLYPCET